MPAPGMHDSAPAIVAGDRVWPCTILYVWLCSPRTPGTMAGNDVAVPSDVECGERLSLAALRPFKIIERVSYVYGCPDHPLPPNRTA